MQTSLTSSPDFRRGRMSIPKNLPASVPPPSATCSETPRRSMKWGLRLPFSGCAKRLSGLSRRRTGWRNALAQKIASWLIPLKTAQKRDFPVLHVFALPHERPWRKEKNHVRRTDVATVPGVWRGSRHLRFIRERRQRTRRDRLVRILHAGMLGHKRARF